MKHYPIKGSPLFVPAGQDETPKSSGFVRECLAAIFIVGAVFWVPWMFYFLTGLTMEF